MEQNDKSEDIRKSTLQNISSVVIKIGTAALTDNAGKIDTKFIFQISKQITEISSTGRRIALVSSGAIGAGMMELNLSRRPETLPMLQAAAAVGQGQLMRTFHDAFGKFGTKVGQILLTRGDFEDRKRYLNIRNTISTLQDLKVIPIINENDTVAVEELESKFGDNDIVAALVTNMLDADLLIILTVVDGVIADGEVLDIIKRIDSDTLKLAEKTRSKLGSGGMISKLQAAKMVTSAGKAVVITNAREPHVLRRILQAEKIGTLCLPADTKISSRRRWIGQAARAAGKIIIDEGAVMAISKRGKSLLPSGIVAISGKFARGDTVSIVDEKGNQIARGLTNYSSDEVEMIKGLKSSQIASVLGEKPYDVVVHRNNMVITP